MQGTRVSIPWDVQDCVDSAVRRMKAHGEGKRRANWFIGKTTTRRPNARANARATTRANARATTRPNARVNARANARATTRTNARPNARANARRSRA